MVHVDSYQELMTVYSGGVGVLPPPIISHWFCANLMGGPGRSGGSSPALPPNLPVVSLLAIGHVTCRHHV